MHKCRDGRTKTAPKAFCDSLPLFMSFFSLCRCFFQSLRTMISVTGGEGDWRILPNSSNMLKKNAESCRKRLAEVASYEYYSVWYFCRRGSIYLTRFKRRRGATLSFFFENSLRRYADRGAIYWRLPASPSAQFPQHLKEPQCNHL